MSSFQDLIDLINQNIEENVNIYSQLDLSIKTFKIKEKNNIKNCFNLLCLMFILYFKQQIAFKFNKILIIKQI